MQKFSPRNLTRPGLLVSAVYLAGIATYCVVERSAFSAMRPSEFGDFLAGVFSPLAFLWLVLGFFQQGDELRNSVAALNLQGEELRNSVEQQRQLVNVTREQLGLEQEAKHTALAEEARLASPIFHISGGFARWSSPICTSKFIVRNIGAACLHAYIFDTNGFDQKVPSFSDHTTVEIDYDIVGEQVAVKQTVTIECVDKLGIKRKFEALLIPESGQYGPVFSVAADDSTFSEILDTVNDT